MSEPAFTRLQVDERRAQLLELGERLFTAHPYAELSMARIAREAGISKALLYHYFPSKQDYFRDTLRSAAEELVRRTETDPTKSPAEQLMTSVDAYLGWIQEHADAYRRLLDSVATVPEVRDLVAEVRDTTAHRILDGLAQGEPVPPGARAAVNGWLWFMDGVCLDWLEHADQEREQVVGLLLGTLVGAITAAGAGHLLARLQEQP